MPVPEVSQFRQVWAEKTAAKEKVMAALGDAALAERDGKDAKKFTNVVAKQGHENGTEGEKQAEAQALADALVVSHPELFTFLEGQTQEAIVSLVDAFRAAGNEDMVTLATIYELAHWERQNIGGTVQAKVRIPGQL